ncbi:udp-glucose 4-epimerase [Paucilactobacillus oligofermentans DSM 15707 = LMG 22743]|uniref:Udp-glucose 4-epimerase n=1 Tax=Paucilactobacillus oligofermentans DSM 15707 = LMG 22743 TaxID=1423778 RepID=A0A0R1RLN9_9LACO|nr:NAD(P)-dependent oxidoreductase [Paucilactobacillus oligofermentans]KRL58045.1 udp-glucose 4-epimerase [Paucilactobacillus oligofermentans DSM 15707 = LMG 22743]CUS26951.1 Putative dehydratase/epimerase [Paucilactobacillus oligofermentans DSM 15707 = LMG 22743]
MRNEFINNLYQSDLTKTASNIKNVNYYLNKSVLVTGATGLVGSYTVETLVKLNDLFNLNINIFAVGRNMKRLRHRFENLKESQVNFIEFDINSKVLELPDINIDVIIHAASAANPKMFEKDPVGTLLTNVESTSKLLFWAHQRNVEKFIFISSGEVYGQLQSKYVPFEESTLGFIDTMNSRSSYPVAKRTAETLCVSFMKQYGLETMIVRPSHLFGPNFTKEDNRVSAQFFRDVIRHENILIKSSGGQLRSYCYISDAVSGLLTVVSSGNTGEAYNITNTENAISMLDFAKKIASEAGQIVESEGRRQNVGNETPITLAVLSDNKLKSLGWKPLYDIDKGINHTYLIMNS